MERTVHPAIQRLRAVHAPTVTRLLHIYYNDYTPPHPPQVNWRPKHPEVNWPTMTLERALTPEEWRNMNFPHYPLPTQVEGQVDTKVWQMKISELMEADEVNEGLLTMMKDISLQLSNGASSHVQSPGTNPTHGQNWFPNPIRELPRVADALATFTAGSHISGPLFNQDSKKLKINPLMAVSKPGGHVRIVGNLKYPRGQSFNDGIPEDRLADWPVKMLTATKFAKMIINAGHGAFMACSDLRDAYKMIPVSLQQRNLQAYQFCGALFIELKLVFGDKLACQFFDKFHHAIIHAFVYPISSFPPVAQGRTVDDIPSVVPSNAKHSLTKFVHSYRAALSKLNISAAEDDPTCTKAFDCSTVGEVLGIRFDTKAFTWSLPHEKLFSLVSELRSLAGGSINCSLRQLESILGKLNHVASLCPPLRTFTSDAVVILAEHISKISDPSGKILDKQRDAHTLCLTLDVSQDLLLVAAIIADTYEHPLPIVDPDPPAPLCAVPIFTDASGHIAGPTSPALGIFFPPHDMKHAAAYSIPFQTDFLLSSNNSALVADTTSTLEALGILVPMVIDPFRCVGRHLHFRIDNIAVVYSFKKRRSKDRLAHSVIRAAYLLAGALACTMSVSWTPRRSDIHTRIADDLTHSDFTSVIELDQYAATIFYPTFPPPLSDWMRLPQYDRNLGHRIIAWMSSQYEDLM